MASGRPSRSQDARHPALGDIYTVSRLNAEVRGLLEGSFPPLWIEGEISNLARPASGHLYFSLKDDEAQVRCAMFRMQARLVEFPPANGAQVLARARVGLYAPRGDYQLVVDYMEESGAGALRRAFEELKLRLAAEGLFAAEHKRPIPPVPKRLGVITSPTGAALRDVLSVVARRCPWLDVLIYPVAVQGTEAAEAICRALALADARAECDVLVLTRGGGSLEDLQAFNEERVARAIHACRIPLVSGVGHETDFTIADLVADQRAPTPSAAAELVTPDGAAWLARRESLQRRLEFLARDRLARYRDQLQWLERRLVHPRRRLEDAAQRVDELASRLRRAGGALLRSHAERLATLRARLHTHHPAYRLTALRTLHGQLAHRLPAAMRGALEARTGRQAALRRALEALGPPATLARGYAIVTEAEDGRPVVSAKTLQPGARTHTHFSDGAVLSTVQARLSPEDGPEDTG